MPDANGHQEVRDRPMADLVKQLSEQTSRLVRAEVELAKAELSEKGRKAGMGAGMFGGAGLFGVFGFAALTTALIALLDTLMVTWLAALSVAAVYLLIAGIAALAGKRKVDQATPLAPQQAIETTRTDVEVTKARVKEARS